MKSGQKVGIYLRLSSEDKDKINKKDDSESIKNQRNMLIDYISKNPQFVLVDEYCDEDLSGAGTYRPEFERLITDCEKGKIDIVLCKSQSRFSRDMEIVEKFINNKFKEWNIRFIGLADNADTENIGNKKSRQINGLINEWYLEDISQNIRSAFYSKMHHGEYISPFAPYGYLISKIDNNKLVVDPVASEVVKEIYNLYVNGFGFTKIANYLNIKKIPCPSLYKYQNGIKLNVISSRPREKIKWNSNAIKKILTNEVYLGHLIQGKRTTVSYKNHKIINKPKEKWIRKENTHKAIIDEETFYKVQKAIKERTKSLKSKGIVHNFSGKVYCKECNHYMRKKNSLKHEYLTCSNNQYGYNECENKASIRYDDLETIILNCINKKIKKFYDIQFLENEIIKRKLNITNENISILKKQRKELKKQSTKINNYFKKIYDDRINKLINEEQFKYLISQYNNEEEQLKERIKTIDDKIMSYHPQKTIEIKEIFNQYQQLKKLNRIIIEEFIDKIYICKTNKKTNSRNIEIVWNF